MAYILSDSFKLVGIKTMGLFLSYPIRENKKTQPKFRTFDILQLGDISKLSTYSNSDEETEYKHSN